MTANHLALAALRAAALPDTPHGSVHPHEGDLPSLSGANGWLNTSPLTTEELRGSVVVADFWTYTCINWRRTLPYLRAWADKYGPFGLVLIGVHTPEFSFEKDVANVRREVQTMDIRYPVAIDNEYAVWTAFDNNFWPALYFADASGHIRHHQFGEGEYAQSEMMIQRLLLEAGADGFARELVSVDESGAEVQADWANLGSFENYLGQRRTENFVSADPPVLDRPRVYQAPERLFLNQWAASGNWTMGSEAAVLNDANGSVRCCFHGRDLHLVMGPVTPGQTVRFRVLIDGSPPGAAYGVDVDEDGFGSAPDQRMYQLIRQPPPITDRQFAIEFLDPGIAVYAFTFG